MKFVTATELRERATFILRDLIKTKEEVVVIKYGKPVALITFISDKDFDSFRLKSKDKQ